MEMTKEQRNLIKKIIDTEEFHKGKRISVYIPANLRPFVEIFREKLGSYNAVVRIAIIKLIEDALEDEQ